MNNYEKKKKNRHLPNKESNTKIKIVRSATPELIVFIFCSLCVEVTG